MISDAPPPGPPPNLPEYLRRLLDLREGECVSGETYRRLEAIVAEWLGRRVNLAPL